MKTINKKDWEMMITFEREQKDLCEKKPKNIEFGDSKFVDELIEDSVFMEIFRRLGDE